MPLRRSGCCGKPAARWSCPVSCCGFPTWRASPGETASPSSSCRGGASDASTALLQGYLRFLGYRTYGWALGRNTGRVAELLPRVLERLAELARGTDRGVHVIGWSLGGYLAREAARERPDRVRQVITLGSPVVGGPKYTAVGAIYRRQGIDLNAIESQVDARYAQVLSTPVTAIYSRSDAVVAWRACIDRRSPHVEHVEVGTTHLGLGFAPEVYSVIAERLARRGCATT